MGNAASTPVKVPSTAATECPVKHPVVATPASSPLSSLEAPKCPISGLEAKNGETCAYDPTKASFWGIKPATVAAPKPVEVKAAAVESESCPMREKKGTPGAKIEKSVGSFVTAASEQYKNPNQYNVYSVKLDPTNNMPTAANQQPAANQQGTLETKRVTSTIPKAGSDDGSWVYPSPQMFWNALVRKGKTDGASEEDMDTVIAVHNNMNETTWKQVLAWENLSLQGKATSADKAPKLLRFMGRPDELSPMARFKMIFGHPAPFDRHDWTVDRGGQEVRYVIDYYHDESAVENDQRPKHLQDISSMQSIKVDVRPALAGPISFLQRLFEMPLTQWVGQTTYDPPTFFPSSDMKHASERKNQRIMTNWKDIQLKCEANKNAMAACDSEESCGAASVALQRCISSVVCPSVSKDFDTCVAAVPHNDTKTGAAFTSMVKCIELFEMDTKQLQQQKSLGGGK